MKKYTVLICVLSAFEIVAVAGLFLAHVGNIGDKLKNISIYPEEILTTTFYKA